MGASETNNCDAYDCFALALDMCSAWFSLYKMSTSFECILCHLFCICWDALFIGCDRSHHTYTQILNRAQRPSKSKMTINVKRTNSIRYYFVSAWIYFWPKFTNFELDAKYSVRFPLSIRPKINLIIKKSSHLNHMQFWITNIIKLPYFERIIRIEPDNIVKKMQRVSSEIFQRN